MWLLPGAFQFFAGPGWWGHQPGQTAMVGVSTYHNQNEVRKFEIPPPTANNACLKKSVYLK
jgi:hypothetical protein